MTNMSYCRFQNTKMDVEDCIEALNDREVSSEDEAFAGKRMFKKILNFCQNEGIIDGFDEEQLKKVFEQATESDDDDDD